MANVWTDFLVLWACSGYLSYCLFEYRFKSLWKEWYSEDYLFGRFERIICSTLFVVFGPVGFLNAYIIPNFSKPLSRK